MPRHRPPHLRALRCAALLLVAAGCVAPPPIVLRPPAPARHVPGPRAREPVRPPRCEPGATRPPLSDAEKSRLFDGFDSWKNARSPSGPAADTPVPPPAPEAARPSAAGCRVPRN